MQRNKLRGIWLAVLFMGILAVSGCGSDSDSSSNDDGTALPAALTTFGGDVALCTPQVESEGLPASEADPTVANWSGWNPLVEHTILSDLLTPDCVEGMFDPITKADMFISILNEFREYWLTSATLPNISMTVDSGGGPMDVVVDVTVDTTVSSVTVPFFTDGSGNPIDQDVDRLITIEGTINGTDTLVAQIAFSTGPDGEVMVVRTQFPDKGETSMFYGIKNEATHELTAWAACYVDHGDGDYMMIALKGGGNTESGTFALTQYKNGSGDTYILAGGEAAGSMAFLAEVGDDADSEGDPWYIVCTSANLSGTEVDEFLNATDSLAGDDRAVLDFVKDGNASCLGYLDAYPESAADIQALIDE
jgi:hypothetical protein